MKKGLFWCKDPLAPSIELITVSVPCDFIGTPTEPAVFTAKCGENFNHKLEWQRLGKDITGGHPFDYYPRGRVEVKYGKVTIYLNPDLNTERVLGRIKEEFELTFPSENVRIVVKNDGSKHYRYGCGKR